MPASLQPWLRRAHALWKRLQTRRAELMILFGLCFSFGLVYHLVDADPSSVPPLALLYEIVIVVGYVALWLAILPSFEKHPPTALRALWTPAAGGLLVMAAVGLIRTTGTPDLTGASPRSVVQAHVLCLLEMGFFFFLMLQLRRLVLFKRTRKSQRNWYLMLALMALASLSTLTRPAGSDPGPLQAVFIVPAVVFMIINSFRLSWIIFLSFRQKMGGAALSIGLITVISVMSGSGYLDVAFSDTTYLQQYSYPLSLFTTLAATFAILYSTTALLSLVFHLPTTSAFQHKADEMAAMHALVHLVDQAFDADKLTQSIAASPVEAGSAYATWLVLDSTSKHLTQGTAGEHEGVHLVAAHNADPRHVEQALDVGAFYDEVRRTRQPLIIPEISTDPRVRDHLLEAASLLVVPLVAHDTFLGVLFAAKEVAHGFEDDDVTAISTFAAQAALALDHARLFGEHIEKERLARELDIARTVQHRLLPHTLPITEGLALAADSISAREVGGDYYDFAQLDDGRIAFIVADVSGKGTSAAFYMAEMQGIFRSGCHLVPAPSDFLSHANEILGGTLQRGTFISVLYGLFDPDRAQLTLARAGHCPAALVRRDGEASFLRPQGLGLGISATPLFRQTLTEEQVSLQPADTLVFYTDGLVESRSPAGEEYGYDRLLRSLKQHHRKQPQALRADLLDDLNTFTRRSDYDDDLTLVVLQWQGPAPPGNASVPEAVSEKALASP